MEKVLMQSFSTWLEKVCINPRNNPSYNKSVFNIGEIKIGRKT